MTERKRERYREEKHIQRERKSERERERERARERERERERNNLLTTHPALFCLSLCSTTGVTKVMIYTILRNGPYVVIAAGFLSISMVLNASKGAEWRSGVSAR